ncbi:MAG: hypothetical protein C0446_08415 [Chitinophaga sp.]|nr:hypothetical protein [Chitinophaga sp.]
MDQTFKFDAGKTQLRLIEPDFIEALGKVLTFGATKYSVNSWKRIEPERYHDAMLRHILAWQKGEKVDKESGLHHLAHAAVNIMFIMYTESLEYEHPI